METAKQNSSLRILNDVEELIIQEEKKASVVQLRNKYCNGFYLQNKQKGDKKNFRN